jgi:hypothetical protein
MERLPYIDAHGVEVAADVDAAWRALVRVVRAGRLGDSGGGWFGRVLGVDPASRSGRWSPEPEAGAALPGFAVDEVRPAKLLSLRGRHRFSRYRLDFELDAAGPTRSHVWARTWADFPGPAGAVYRALVISSGAHARIVRRILRRIAKAANSANTPTSVSP